MRSLRSPDSQTALLFARGSFAALAIMNARLPHDAEAVLTFLPTEHGGRRGPAFSNYRPQFYYDGRDWDAHHTYPDVETVNPGDTVRVILSFLSPDQHIGTLRVGSPFLIREGQKIVGYGAITKLVELEASAKRARVRLANKPLVPTRNGEAPLLAAQRRR